ncbi:mannose-1-phosphate guanylyltransferase [Thiovulum sp. ES]|nr:mannose-1-phosphate guanylyltransferase [Thiovulum sp. ES]
MENLIHKIYASREVEHFSQEKILEMLKKAKEKNRDLNITGMLLYENGSFFQVLEGSEKDVSELFEKIKYDERHTNIVEIISESIYQRDFENWSMGYAHLEKEDIEKLDGMNDFFSDGKCIADISKGRSKKLLNAFLKGKWRLQ